MPETKTIQKIYDELKSLRRDVTYIKEHMEDTVLTLEEEARLEEALKEYKEGKTTSLEDFRKEMGD